MFFPVDLSAYWREGFDSAHYDINVVLPHRPFRKSTKQTLLFLFNLQFVQLIILFVTKAFHIPAL